MYQLCTICLLLTTWLSLHAQSIFPQMPPEKRARIVGGEAFPLQGSHADVIQKAINAGGIVFIPSGDYIIDKTIHIPKGVRVYGVGESRPRLLVKQGTPYFNDKRRKSVISFSPQKGKKGNDTFYSGLVNVDIRIEKNNKRAIAVHYDVAQGCILQHMDIHLAPGNIGIQDTGSEITAVRIYGGDFAVSGHTMAWQLLVTDCVFDGQIKAAFRTRNCGPTVFRSQFSNTPVAFAFVPGKNERVYVQDCMFENITRGVIITDKSQRASTQFNAVNCTYKQVPQLIAIRDGEDKGIEPDPVYSYQRVSYGLHLDVEAQGDFRLSRHGRGAEALPMPETDVPVLPPASQWVNVRDHGVVGDGKTDDTAAIQAVIAKHTYCFFPRGRYLVSDTITLGVDTHCFGLHPRATMIVMKPHTPGYEDPNTPKGIIVAPEGSRCRWEGIGIQAEYNPSAVSLWWHAGEQSILNDFWISWSGKGSGGRKGTKHHGQYCSVWIQGGGTFKNIWIANKQSPLSMRISDTDQRGVMYMASLEHHDVSELEMFNVSNWTIHAPQTENTVRARHVESGVYVKPLIIENCTNLIFTMAYIYHTTGTQAPAPNGIYLKDCSNITFLGARNWNYKQKPAKLTAQHNDTKVSQKDFTYWRIP